MGLGRHLLSVSASWRQTKAWSRLMAKGGQGQRQGRQRGRGRQRFAPGRLSYPPGWTAGNYVSARCAVCVLHSQNAER